MRLRLKKTYLKIGSGGGILQVLKLEILGHASNWKLCVVTFFRIYVYTLNLLEEEKILRDLESQITFSEHK